MSLAVVAIGAAAVGYTAYQSNMASKSQKSAQLDAQRNAEAQAKAADQAMNAANRKSPNVRNILESNSSGSGLSGTMLTGPQGVSTDKLQLGKSTLLGM